MRPDLAACYGQERLPRYTSYPTAPHFSAAIGPGKYAEWLKAIPPARHRVALSARAVLPVDVLVLRLQHLGGPPRRPDRRLCRGAALRNRPGVAADRSPHQGRPHPFRRRHADHHGARDLRRSDGIDPAVLLRAALGRDRHRDRPAHADRPDDRRARLRRRQPGEPRRAELRSRGAARHQPGAEFRGDRRGDRQACGGPASPASISI